MCSRYVGTKAGGPLFFPQGNEENNRRKKKDSKYPSTPPPSPIQHQHQHQLLNTSLTKNQIAQFQPPPSYRPILPSTTTTTTSTSTSTTSSSSTPTHPDLITRYNLASRLSSGVPAGEDAEAGGPSKPLWSNDGKERQALLQRRREEMVLNARRKLEAEEKQKREEEEERSRRRRGEIGGVGR